MRYNAVSLSGLPGSGKNVLTEILSKKLDWTSFSAGDSWRTLYAERHPRGEISFEEFFKQISLQDNLNMDLKMKQLLEEGEVIVDSRYSALYAGDSPVLKIFLTADLSLRTDRAFDVCKYSGKSARQISELLKERERNEVELGRLMYDGVDFREAVYDLILDSGHLTPSQEASIIVHRIKG